MRLGYYGVPDSNIGFLQLNMNGEWADVVVQDGQSTFDGVAAAVVCRALGWIGGVATWSLWYAETSSGRCAFVQDSFSRECNVDMADLQACSGYLSNSDCTAENPGFQVFVTCSTSKGGWAAEHMCMHLWGQRIIRSGAGVSTRWRHSKQETGSQECTWRACAGVHASRGQAGHSGGAGGQLDRQGPGEHGLGRPWWLEGLGERRGPWRKGAARWAGGRVQQGSCRLRARVGWQVQGCLGALMGWCIGSTHWWASQSHMPAAVVSVHVTKGSSAVQHMSAQAQTGLPCQHRCTPCQCLALLSLRLPCPFLPLLQRHHHPRCHSG